MDWKHAHACLCGPSPDFAADLHCSGARSGRALHPTSVPVRDTRDLGIRQRLLSPLSGIPLRRSTKVSRPKPDARPAGLAAARGQDLQRLASARVSVKPTRHLTGRSSMGSPPAARERRLEDGGEKSSRRAPGGPAAISVVSACITGQQGSTSCLKAHDGAQPGSGCEQEPLLLAEA